MGTGPALLIVPGAPAVAADYDALAAALAERFTVHTVERRGRGTSGPQGDAYGADAEAADIEAVRAATRETAAGDLRIRGDRVVVVWAAAAARENDIGPWPPTVLSARPGWYAVTCGWHEGARGRYMSEAEIHTPSPPSAEEDWSCFWIRLIFSGIPKT
ncbi:hypothetical protein [Embleya sp. NPDC059237]|uniref:hypothetical protein n=1 Tax=Embleya sp. NPDC059237 TaxID=3346784 RepID=UPI00369EEEC2